MKHPLSVITVFFVIGSLIWMLFHGRWEAAYTVRENHDTLSYLMDLDSRPLWDKPAAPGVCDFAARFSESTLPDSGRITVSNKWDWWLCELFLIWLTGSLVIVPISFFAFRRERTLGVFARVGAGLIVSALACFLLWLAIGGWGPPVPLFFAVTGVLGGAAWALVHARKRPGA